MPVKKGLTGNLRFREGRRQTIPSQDFIDLFDTLPPGSDEIVALTEVLEKVKDGRSVEPGVGVRVGPKTSRNVN